MTKPRTRCTFCDGPIQPDDDRPDQGTLRVGDGEAPRVNVNARTNTYDGGRRVAVLHPACWVFIEGALPILRHIRETAATLPAAYARETTPAPSCAVRDPSHESDRAALDLLSDDELEARLRMAQR